MRRSERERGKQKKIKKSDQILTKVFLRELSPFNNMKKEVAKKFYNVYRGKEKTLSKGKVIGKNFLCYKFCIQFDRNLKFKNLRYYILMYFDFPSAFFYKCKLCFISILFILDQIKKRKRFFSCWEVFSIL